MMKNEKEKDKPQINMSFGENYNNKQNNSSKEKESPNNKKVEKQNSINKTVTFSSIEKKK